ncbi:hypothetical protein EYF80_044786 [Liparis tanakae]|uniref:Uncharacterized protein n=1 Tax=Liparis tanakae TaxID=230148 RepID=A0A4Z2FWV6_9TELE|nr:hypothetical protein EYF80_044786 [Liparis tanakae]
MTSPLLFTPEKKALRSVRVWMLDGSVVPRQWFPLQTRHWAADRLLLPEPSRRHVGVPGGAQLDASVLQPLLLDAVTNPVAKVDDQAWKEGVEAFKKSIKN